MSNGRIPALRPLVTQDSTTRLPRSILLLLVLVYALTGFAGHEPWKGAEAIAFGLAIDWLSGQASWPGEVHLVHLAAAWSMRAFAPLLDPATASRLPHMVALIATFAAVWYSTYHLARREQAQPAPLPFGGQAHPVAYARSVADGALLGLIACLGLLGRGHEGVPEVVQMAAVAGVLYGLCVSPSHPVRGACSLASALVLLALCGAPRLALALSAATFLLMGPQRDWRPRLAALVCIAPSVALTLLGPEASPSGRPPAVTAAALFNLALWFWWPLWLIGGYGLWLRRRDLSDWGLLAPGALLLLVCISAWMLGASDLALLPTLPLLAVFAGLNLPYLRRTQLALLDWFAVALCSIGALTLWLVWSAGQFDWPSPIARNIDKLYPGFRETEAWPFSPTLLSTAIVVSLTWCVVVVWRTARLRHPIWKGMVLSASGVTLCWLLLQTLGSPLVHYSRSFGSVAASIAADVASDQCLQIVGLGDSQRILLSYLSQRRFASGATSCGYALLQHPLQQSPWQSFAESEWQLLWTGRRASDRSEVFSLLVRKTPGRSGSQVAPGGS
jgi:hypothetical protein